MRLFSNMKKIKIITLGCDKNLVDSEVLSGQLSGSYEISPDFTSGEAVQTKPGHGRSDPGLERSGAGKGHYHSGKERIGTI